MPIITIPDVVRLGAFRVEDPQPWTRQPDGGELYVGDLISSSEEAEKTVNPIHAEMRAFMAPEHRLEARALRPYQNECVEAVFNAWKSGRRAPLIVMGTGAGKTITAAEIVRRLRDQHQGFGYRVWFVAHREELIKQTYRAMKMIAPEATCGIVQGKHNDIGKFITVASIDTIASERRFNDAIHGHNGLIPSLVAKPPSLMILDECHHSTSPKYKRLLSWIQNVSPDCALLGMTATPGRTDGTALDQLFDCVAYERNIFQLIADGYLVPPVGFEVKLNINLDVIPTEVDGEFKKAPLSKVMNQPHICDAIVNGYISHGESRKMVAFCCDVEHARELARAFRTRGIIANHVDGSMKKADRDATLQAFTDGATRILTSCDVLTEGYDEPSIQGAIMARPTDSQVVYIQSVGRALRLHPSKRDALILDCVGNSQKHKLAQLANISGLQDLRAGYSNGPGDDQPKDDDGMIDAELGGTEIHRIDFTALRRRQTQWHWRETRFGWTVSIPRIGYFLLAWASNDRTVVDVKYHDQRNGKRNDLPISLSKGLDFNLAYGMVESEIERLFSARSSRARMKENEGSQELNATRDAMDEAMQNELFSPEELMRNDARWRDQPTSHKQRDALIKIGVKPASVPMTAGEASDLYSVMTIEHDAKMREPVTEKQRVMILRQKLATAEELDRMTKRQAAGLIVKFLKEKESKKKAEHTNEEPFPMDEDQ